MDLTDSQFHRYARHLILDEVGEEGQEKLLASRVLVVGDSLGDGLWSGLYRAFEDDATLEFIQRAKPSTGFVRPDSYDWNNELADLLKNDTYQIAVIMFGANDAQPIKSGKDWLKPGSEGWREIYGQRVEAFIKKLRAGMMPPPGMPRPGGDTLITLVQTLETTVDAAARTAPNLGVRRFQRPSRAEYERVVHELLALEVDASKWLPADLLMGAFDNQSAAQPFSPTLL